MRHVLRTHMYLPTCMTFSPTFISLFSPANLGNRPSTKPIFFSLHCILLVPPRNQTPLYEHVFFSGVVVRQAVVCRTENKNPSPRFRSHPPPPDTIWQMMRSYQHFSFLPQTRVGEEEQEEGFYSIPSPFPPSRYNPKFDKKEELRNKTGMTPRCVAPKTWDKVVRSSKKKYGVKFSRCLFYEKV